jgi:hypothetical protein
MLRLLLLLLLRSGRVRTGSSRGTRVEEGVVVIVSSQSLSLSARSTIRRSIQAGFGRIARDHRCVPRDMLVRLVILLLLVLLRRGRSTRPTDIESELACLRIRFEPGIPYDRRPPIGLHFDPTCMLLGRQRVRMVRRMLLDVGRELDDPRRGRPDRLSRVRLVFSVRPRDGTIGSGRGHRQRGGTVTRWLHIHVHPKSASFVIRDVPLDDRPREWSEPIRPVCSGDDVKRGL